MVAVNPFRAPVAGPPFVDRPFSLWTAVEDRSGLVDPLLGPHWRNGVNFNSLCGIGGNTYDDYCTDASAATKAANVTIPRRGATPMTPFVELDCSPVGYDQQEQRSLAAAALTNTEMYQVEQMFWTGTAGGDANQVYPHLAASAAVDETSGLYSVRLQCAATQVSGSTAFDVTEGIGRLEAALTACSGGMGVIHVPYVLGEMLFRANLAKVNGAKLMTQTGHQVVLGAGYPGTAPDGTAPPAGAVWVYGTSPLFGYRSDLEQPASYRESLDRSENTVKTIAERTYVVAFDCCCLYAVLISTGGIVTGVPLSAF